MKSKMVSSASILEFFLSLAINKASAVSAGAIHEVSSPQGLQWGPCKLDAEHANTTFPVQCAKLTVPLDYIDSSNNRTIDLDLIKYPAQKEPKRGSILLNFGGPGQDGLNSMVDYIPLMAPYVTAFNTNCVEFLWSGISETNYRVI